MKFNYSKLKGKIKEVYGTQDNFAKEMNLSNATITNKLNNVRYFTAEEIWNTINLLHIPSDEINIYFFNPLVE